MKAPEKIYLYPYSTDGIYEVETKPLEGTIEYIRADAFIKKAAAWLKEHKEIVETEDNGIMGWIPDYFIDAFKKYMKGE